MAVSHAKTFNKNDIFDSLDNQNFSPMYTFKLRSFFYTLFFLGLSIACVAQEPTWVLPVGRNQE